MIFPSDFVGKIYSIRGAVVHTEKLAKGIENGEIVAKCHATKSAIDKVLNAGSTNPLLNKNKQSLFK